MIVRVSEAYLHAGMEAEFMQLLLDLVADFPRRHSGLLRHEVLVDHADPQRVQYVSTWSDEAALVSYAGNAWRSAPVTFPGEERFLMRPLDVRHFESYPIGG